MAAYQIVFTTQVQEPNSGFKLLMTKSF